MVSDNMDSSRKVSITYKNYKGIIAVRNVIPITFWFGVNKWYTESQWIMTALDIDKHVIREFAMKNILNWADKEVDLNEKED